MTAANRAYYFLKPFIPWQVRVNARRILAEAQLRSNGSVWPIDEMAGVAPAGWPGWPDGRKFAFVLTHDVEGIKGYRRIERLMKLETRYGFRSSFNLVPRGEYDASDQMIALLGQSGFEVGVHGLEHDGKLYSSKAQFARKAIKINEYMERWGATGFRSPLMQHRLGWLHQLNAEYDASTFDTDPFEPESDGVRTAFPFWVPGPEGSGFVELPYTLVQDFTLFVVLRETNIKKWTDKLDWIAQRGGMAMLITHPDYMSFGPSVGERDEFPVALYEEFLSYAHEKYGKCFWKALPRDVSKYYRACLPAGGRNTRRKVCMVAHSHYESDNRVRRYAESLAARGDIVDVVALQSSSRRGSAYVLSSVNVFEIQTRPGNEKGKWNYAWQLLRFLLGSFRFVSRRHRSVRYDLIHVHNIPDFLVLSAIYPKWTGAKIILDIHDLVPELFEGKFNSRANSVYLRFLKEIERLSCAFADHVIISNHLWKERLTARSVSPGKCSVFVNHVDPAIFSRRARKREDGKIVLLFPGTFQAHQGLNVAIKALGRLKARLPGCELHLYGGGAGSARADLTQLATDLALNGRVRFFDPVPLDTIPELMANADVGVVPKLAEGFGNEAYSTKIMEFMSQGIPVVASRTAIDSYYFSDDTVCFFKSGDDMAMAEVLLNVIEDNDLRNRMSRNGLAYAAQNDWSSKKKEYLWLVDSVCCEGFDTPTNRQSG